MFIRAVVSAIDLPSNGALFSTAVLNVAEALMEMFKLNKVLCVEKQGGDARTEGKRAYIGVGTVSRSVYRKEKKGAPNKPPTYLHIQIESGVHRVGRTPENVNTPYLYLSSNIDVCSFYPLLLALPLVYLS